MYSVLPSPLDVKGWGSGSSGVYCRGVRRVWYSLVLGNVLNRKRLSE